MYFWFEFIQLIATLNYACYAIHAQIKVGWLTSLKNYDHTNIEPFEIVLGALDDFDASNQAKSQVGDVDSNEDTANMEMWRDKLAA